MNDIEKISISEEEAIEATIRCLTADYGMACKGCPIDKINKKYKEYCQERCQAAWDMAAKCLEEIKLYKDGKLCLVPEDVYSIQCCALDAYKEIGTVEECREAREKQKQKTPVYEGDGFADGHMVYDIWICPNCGAKYEVDYDDFSYCPKCGQAINREESEE